MALKPDSHRALNDLRALIVATIRHVATAPGVGQAATASLNVAAATVHAATGIAQWADGLAAVYTTLPAAVFALSFDRAQALGELLLVAKHEEGQAGRRGRRAEPRCGPAAGQRASGWWRRQPSDGTNGRTGPRGPGAIKSVSGKSAADAVITPDRSVAPSAFGGDTKYIAAGGAVGGLAGAAAVPTMITGAAVATTGGAAAVTSGLAGVGS